MKQEHARAPSLRVALRPEAACLKARTELVRSVLALPRPDEEQAGQDRRQHNPHRPGERKVTDDKQNDVCDCKRHCEREEDDAGR